MARDFDDVLDHGLAQVPGAFQGIRPLLAGVAAALVAVETPGAELLGLALPSNAEDAWLDLIARGEGLQRQPSEADAQLRGRLAATAHRVTPNAFERAVAGVLEGTGIGWTVVEHWQARTYCDADPGDERVTDAFCDELTLLPAHNGVSVVLDASPSTAVGDALAVAVRDVRGVGIRCWLVVQAGDIVFARSYELA